MKSCELLSQLWQLLQFVVEDAAPELQKLNLYPRAFFLLEKVQLYSYPAQLAEALFLPAPTVSFIVKHLEEAGYLERQMDRSDLRRYRLSVTPKGEEVIRAGRAAIDSSMRVRMARLTKDELAEVGKSLATMLRKE